MHSQTEVWERGESNTRPDYGFSAATAVYALFALFPLLAGCVQEMANQPRVKTYGGSAFFPDGVGARPQVAGTISRDQPWEETPEVTGRKDGKLIARMPVELTAARLEHGRERFGIFCAHCHGWSGYGDGMVVQRGFPAPPSYHIDRLRSAPDGHIFDVITNGIGRMPSLGPRITPVVAGPMCWPIEQFEPTLRRYREWLPTAPEDVYAFYLTAEVPAAEPFPKAIHGRKVCGLVWCCTGSEDQSSHALQAARDAASPLFEHVGRMPYPVLQSLFDGLYPPGLQWYWKGDILREISDDAIAAHRRFAEVPTSHSTMHLYPINGAVHRVPAEKTAWLHRDANWSMVIAGVDPDPANVDGIKQWARDYWQAVHPFSAGAAYVNFLMDEGHDRVQATYGGNFERLRAVKSRFDPDNFFHVNQNIEPAA